MRTEDSGEPARQDTQRVPYMRIERPDEMNLIDARGLSIRTTDGPIPAAISWPSSTSLTWLALFLSTSSFGVSVWTSKTVMALECFDKSTPVGAQARRTRTHVSARPAAAHKLRLIIFPDAARERRHRAEVDIATVVQSFPSDLPQRPELLLDERQGGRRQVECLHRAP